MADSDEFKNSMAHKGIAEQYGKIETSLFYSEGKGTDTDIKINPEYREITCLADFFRILKEIHTEHEKSKPEHLKKWGSKFLYRGQANVNYTFVPSIMRKEDDLLREHLLCKEFHRQFYDLLDNCKYMIEEEVLMQHFGLGSRCLDLLENPLVALWAAVEPGENGKHKDMFGELSIWCLDDYWEDLKTYDSLTVSAIANTAIMEDWFTLDMLEMAYMKEQPNTHKDFIYIKDVLRRTAIVMPKFNNQRIKNQQTVFAIMNLNELVDEDYSFESKFGVSIKQFTEYILNTEVINQGKGFDYMHPNVAKLRQGLHTLRGADFSNLTSSDLHFQKVVAKESSYIDYFDLYKYLYKGRNATEKEWHPVTIIVLPKYKEDIEKELRYLNITKAFIYPELQNVAEELKQTYGLQK